MSLANFVADLAADAARRVVVICEDVTQTVRGLGGGSGEGGGGHAKKENDAVYTPFSTERTVSRSLIRASDIVPLFGLRDEVDVLAVTYDDQKHVRNVEGKSTVFIDDRGFMRVLAKLVATASREPTVPPPSSGPQQQGAAVVDAYNDDGQQPQQSQPQPQRRVRRKPYVLLDQDLTRIAQVFPTKATLAKAAGLKSAALADARMKEEGGRGRCRSWHECSSQLKSEYLRRQPAPSGEPGRGSSSATTASTKKNGNGNSKISKLVDQLEGGPDGRVVRTYDSMTQAAVGVGGKPAEAYYKLKQAIDRGTAWKNYYWRFSPSPSPSSSSSPSPSNGGHDNNSDVQ